MNWFVLSLAAACLFTIVGLLQKSLLKEKEVDSLSLAILFQFLVVLLILPLVVRAGFALPAKNFLYLRLLLMGAIYTLGASFWFRAVKLTPISEVALISTSQPFFVLLGSSLFFGEPLTPFKILGILFLTLGIIVVYWQKGTLKSFGRGQFYALLATTLFAAGLLNDFSIVAYFSLPTYIFLGYLLPGVGLTFLSPSSLAKIKLIFTRKRILLAVLMSLASVSAISSVYLAYLSGGEASKVLPITRVSAVLTVAFAAIFLGEKEKLLRKLIGSILVVLGIVFLR